MPVLDELVTQIDDKHVESIDTDTLVTDNQVSVVFTCL